MKKILLITITALSFSTQAQITITSSDVPSAGVQMINVREQNIIGIFPGSAGSNQTYDFSGFVNGGEDTVSYLMPSQTPYAASFSNSNLASYTSTDSSYTFFQVSPSLLEVNGMIMPAPIGTEKAVAKATNPLTQMSIPSTYQTTFTDLGEFSTNSFAFFQVISQDPYTYFDSIKASIAINRTSEIDGWGTLVTPFSSSYSVLRQKVTDITTITPQFNTVLVDTILNTPITYPLGYQTIPGTEFSDTTTTYFYLTNTNNGQPLILAEIQENAAGVVTSAKYAKLPFAALDELSKVNSNIFVFPNPTIEKIQVNATSKINQIDIYTVDGRMIEGFKLDATSFDINLTNLPKGIYNLLISTEKGIESKRIEKI